MPYYEAALERHKELCVCHMVQFLTSRQPEQCVVSMLKDTLRLADAQKECHTQETHTQLTTDQHTALEAHAPERKS